MNLVSFGQVDFDLNGGARKATLLISLLSVWVLVGLFVYLNRFTRRKYFTLWTVGWLFYALWLTLTLLLPSLPYSATLLVWKQWCVGVTAVFILWGSLRFMGVRVRPSLFAWFIIFLLIWSSVGATSLQRWHFEIPFFALVSAVSVVTSACFFQFRRSRGFIGGTLLSLGFLLWAIFFGSYPFLQSSERLATAGFFITAVIQLFIAVSMIILVLEEMRNSGRLRLAKLREQKSARQVLQTRFTASEERYRALFEQASEAIVITTPGDFRIVDLNRSAARLLQITPSAGRDHLLTAFFQEIGTGVPPADWFDSFQRLQPATVVGKNGAASLVEVQASRVDIDGQPACEFFLREITERVRLEQQLRQSEKLSALGGMISGVAHELNNPLAVIQGYLELTLSRDGLPPETRASLEKVAQETERTSRLVQNFLNFARDKPARREPLRLHEVLRELVALRNLDLLAGAIDLQWKLDPREPVVTADPEALPQALAHLLNNAIQAVGETPSARRLRLTTTPGEENVEICLEDSGPGVPAHLAQKIFEPFFTTKPVGTGPGLGLSIAHSIISDHGGQLTLESSTLGGAGFRVVLPVRPASPTFPATEVSAPEGTPVSARILVLDDEAAIAELLSEMLQLLGHRPTVCTAPQAALDQLETESFDLVLSDFRMPGMDGREFYGRVREKNPRLADRIIFLTGDVVNDETQGFLEGIGNPHLPKPFQLNRIAETISAVLGKTAPTGRSPEPGVGGPA